MMTPDEMRERFGMPDASRQVLRARARKVRFGRANLIPRPEMSPAQKAARLRVSSKVIERANRKRS